MTDTNCASLVLNLFYEEPDPDRWLPLDRFPRRVVRRMIRGRPRPGGQARVFLNLCAGLDRLGVPYRVNDYRYIRAHPKEPACVIGKPFVLDKIEWKNPILFGSAVFSHPLAAPDLLARLPIQKVLVPGEWMRLMCEPFWKEKVAAWPVGIDTEKWKPVPNTNRDIDFLVYDKVMWQRDRREVDLLQPIRDELRRRGLTTAEIRYGHYREEAYAATLRRAAAMIFLCEHETQGIAYQQALSAGVPILAWDRGGLWEDPEFYPERVKYGPVSSVPYWDDRCGAKFESRTDFPIQLDKFLKQSSDGLLSPREFILENLTLEKGAEAYLQFVSEIT